MASNKPRIHANSGMNLQQVVTYLQKYRKSYTNKALAEDLANRGVLIDTKYNDRGRKINSGDISGIALNAGLERFKKKPRKRGANGKRVPIAKRGMPIQDSTWKKAEAFVGKIEEVINMTGLDPIERQFLIKKRMGSE